MASCPNCKQSRITCVCESPPFYKLEWRPVLGGVYKIWVNNIPIEGVLLRDKTKYPRYWAKISDIYALHLVLWDVKRKCIAEINTQKKNLKVKYQYKGINIFKYLWVNLIHWRKILF